MCMRPRDLRQSFQNLVRETHTSLGDIVPNFESETTKGNINFYDFAGNSWTLVCSHPSVYTPVCTSELVSLSDNYHKLLKRNVKVLAVSCSDIEDHKQWELDIQALAKVKRLQFPICADKDRAIAILLGIIDAELTDDRGVAFSSRATVLIDDEKRIRFVSQYPVFTGRNMTEILRVIDSLKLTQILPAATPVDWKAGDDVFVLPTISHNERLQSFPNGYRKLEVPSRKEYILYASVPQNFGESTDDDEQELTSEATSTNPEWMDRLFVTHKPTQKLSWSKNEIERPEGRRYSGSGYIAVYTPDQQKKLGVDEHGFKHQQVVWPCIEAPAGMQEVNGVTELTYTLEQQIRLNVDRCGNVLEEEETSNDEEGEQAGNHDDERQEPNAQTSPATRSGKKKICVL